MLEEGYDNSINYNEDNFELDNFQINRSVTLEEPEPNKRLPMETLEGFPSSIVGECVNVITGDYVESHLDLKSNGPSPFYVQRTYCSSGQGWGLEYKQSLTVLKSDGKHHFNAFYVNGNGSGIPYRAKISSSEINGYIDGPFKVVDDSFNKYITNCGNGEISGKTNLKNSKINYIKGVDKKYYILTKGDGTKSYFKLKEKLVKNHESGAEQGIFHLDKEVYLNGNRLDYVYDEDRTSKPIKEVICNNSQGEKINVLQVVDKEKEKKFTLGNDSVEYKYSSDNIKHVNFSSGFSVDYDYEYGYLKQRKEPNGRYLKIDYDGTFNWENGRVIKLSGPVGLSNKEAVIYTFEYFDEKSSPYTDVYDAEKNLTRYNYSKHDKRLTSIIKFDVKKNVYSEDKFTWSSTQPGNLISRELKSNNISHFKRSLKYDSFGNVTENKISGNLTGIKKYHGLHENYEIKYVYSQDGYNLLLEEDNGRTQIEFAYYAKTNQLKHKFTKHIGSILKREFFEYDKNGVLVVEIVDDGSSIDKDDIDDITERHLKKITPTTQHPIGLPEVIEESYWCSFIRQYVLLKKVVNKYSPEGKLIEQKHYDCENQLAYALHWKYDKLGNVIEKDDELGNITTYKFDLHNNKIYESGPRPGYYAEFSYDHANRLIQEKEYWPDGKKFTTTHTYNSLNQRVSTTDSNGNKMQHKYDILGRIIETTMPPLFSQSGSHINNVIKTEYDVFGNPTKRCVGKSECTKKSYNIRGTPILIEYADKTVESKTYSIDGLLEEEISKNSVKTLYYYDPLGRVILTEIRDKDNNLIKTKSATYTSFRLLSETDEEGITTIYTYDEAGRKISECRGNVETKYSYDSLGRVSKIHNVISSNEARITYKYYDMLGRVIEEKITDLAGQNFKLKHYKYDEDGNKILQVEYSQAGKAETKMEYNPDGELTCVIDPVGNKTTIKYEYCFKYQDLNVLKKTKEDPLGNKEISIYDTRGNIACLIFKDLKDVTQRVEKNFYDFLNRKILTYNTVFIDGIEKNTLITEWIYDAAGNILKLVEAKNTKEERVTSYTYNQYGQKENACLPNGVEINQSYNSLGLLKEYTSSDGSIHFLYSYDTMDRLISVKDIIHNIETLREYDVYGLLIKETLANGLIISYSYDLLGRITSVTYPDFTSCEYKYDALHLRCVSRIKNRKVIYKHEYVEYDLSENILHENLINNIGSVFRSYDLNNRVVLTSSPYWKEVIPEGGYDSAGNLLCRKVSDLNGSINYSYEYNSLYQLTKEKGIFTHNYKNDSLNNIVKKDDSLCLHNALNQLLSNETESYEYDKNGNLILKSDGETTVKYKYDALSRLIEVCDGFTTTTYRYDPFHRRISKITDKEKTDFIYQGQNEIGSYVNNKIAQLRILGLVYLGEIGATVAIELDGKAYAVIHDPYGNIVSILDQSGECVENYRYSAYGEDEIYFNHLNIPWRFSSKRYDSETGFYYFGFRYYDPKIARWTTPDPEGFVDGPNLYAYVHNNPLIFKDPDGRFAQFILPLLGGIALMEAVDYGIAESLPYIADHVDTHFGEDLGSYVRGASDTYSSADNLEPGTIKNPENYKRGALIGTGLRLLIDWGNPVKKSLSKGGTILFKRITKEAAKGTSKTISTVAKQSFPTTEIPKKFKTFNQNNARDNLKEFTGIYPPTKIQAHHVFPQKHRARMAGIGINIDEPKYMNWWESPAHQRASGPYNKAWDRFLLINDYNPSKEQTLEFGREIMSKYGFDVFY